MNKRFLIELHSHTVQGSICGRGDATFHVKHYHELGYSGMVFTDHFLNHGCRVPSDISWEEKVEMFFSFYDEALEYAKSIGFHAYVGWEWGYDCIEVLTYGLDKQWLLEHPDINKIPVEQYCALAREGGAFLAQPHPYRENYPIIKLAPRHVHALEVLNANNNDFSNGLADHLADAYGLIKTCGSDNHNGIQHKYWALALKEEPTSYEKLLSLLREGNHEFVLKSDET